jgi:hypothetical protein
MKKIISAVFIVFLTTCCFGQIKTLDFEKYNDCKLNIEINYKDREKDYTEAQKYKDVEIILIQANKDGKVKSIKRGFVSTIVKGDYKGTFFESVESKNANSKTAEFPLFNDKKYFCYLAKCFDSIVPN